MNEYEEKILRTRKQTERMISVIFSVAIASTIVASILSVFFSKQ